MSVEAFGTIGGLNTAWPQSADLIAEGDDHIRGTKVTLKTVFPNFGTGVLMATPAELNYSVGLTGLIQTQLDAKAPKASPTFSGTVALPASTSIGSVDATELGYLDGVTAPLQGQINAKAPLASPALTGTPTAPTASAGTNSTQVATTAFVVAQALSGSLPGQSGNGGRYIMTDGTTASWQFPRLRRFRHTSSGAAVLNALNILAAPGLAMTVPVGATSDVIQFSSSGNPVGCTIDWGAALIQGSAPGVMTVDDPKFKTPVLQLDATDGWV